MRFANIAARRITAPVSCAAALRTASEPRRPSALKSASREIFRKSRASRGRKRAYRIGAYRDFADVYEKPRQDRQSLQTDPVGYEVEAFPDRAVFVVEAEQQQREHGLIDSCRHRCRGLWRAPWRPPSGFAVEDGFEHFRDEAQLGLGQPCDGFNLQPDAPRSVRQPEPRMAASRATCSGPGSRKPCSHLARISRSQPTALARALAVNPAFRRAALMRSPAVSG